MRDLPGGLEQREAFLGFDEVHPPPALLPRERQPVEIGVLPAQRELEAALAVRIAVAAARVASRLAQHRHDIAPEFHLRTPRGEGGEDCKGEGRESHGRWREYTLEG